MLKLKIEIRKQNVLQFPVEAVLLNFDIWTREDVNKTCGKVNFAFA